MCIKAGFGMCWVGGGCVRRELKVLDKTKWIWQTRLIRQGFGDLFQTRRKRKKSTDFSSLSKAPIDYVSVYPNKTVNVQQYRAMWGNYNFSFLADWKQSCDQDRKPILLNANMYLLILQARVWELISQALIANRSTSLLHASLHTQLRQ